MRLFIALLPPLPLKPALARLADVAHERCAGQRIADDNLHVTLAFLGDQPESLAQALALRIEAMQLAPEQWHLNRWGYFPRPGIVWIGSDQPNAALHTLQASLWDELASLGIEGRPASFIPHVSLLRRAAAPPESVLPDVPDLTWRYQRLALVHSVMDQAGSRYRVLARSAPWDSSSA